MRALVADPDRSPAVALADVPEPRAGHGELLVQVDASSVNRGEVRYASRSQPGTVIGWDVAGTVLEVGEGAEGFAAGDRVVALAPSGGAWAEKVAVPAEWAAPLPSDCDPVLAATLPVAGLTALGILRLGKVHAGDRVLVTGAAGGVGLFTVQLAVEAGATVTGQVRTEARGEAVREAGGEPLLHPGDGSPVEGAFDVILDSIGGPMLRPLLQAATPRGRVVLYGNSADAESTFRVEELYAKGLEVHGFRVFTSVAPDQAVRDLGQLVDHVLAGRLAVKVQATAPLAEALPLIADLYDRKVTGKVVITRT